jgi:hypothetical protein
VVASELSDRSPLGILGGLLHHRPITYPAAEEGRQMSEYDWRGYIDVTDIPLARLVVEAFRLSLPVGRGYEAPFMRALSEEEALRSVQHHTNCVSVDYIHGRAVKLLVRFDHNTGRSYLPVEWPYHNSEQLSRLLERAGVHDVQPDLLSVSKHALEKVKDEEDSARKRDLIVLAELAERMGRSRFDSVLVDATSAWGIAAMPHLLSAVRQGWARTTDYKLFSLTDAGRTVCAQAIKKASGAAG